MRKIADLFIMPYRLLQSFCGSFSRLRLSLTTWQYLLIQWLRVH